MVKIYNGRSYFWQWELDQKLIVKAPNCTEVHFEDDNSDVALVCEVYELDGKRVVNVPNIILQTAGNLIAYIVFDNTTIRKSRFVVNPRQKPADYVYTETECWTVEGAVERALQEAKESGEFNGADGSDGITPHIGANGNWFIGDTDTGNPSRGKKGEQGNTGADGYTPVKGVDYFTEAEKQEIVNDVLETLPIAEGVSV